jgi:outer membrane lipoprotein-sorting protein
MMTFLAAALFAVMAFAQTPEEIVARMEEEMNKHEHDGLVMVIDVKIPILGTMSTTSYALDNKTRVEGEMSGVKFITWSDGKTQWTYNKKENTIEIENEKPGAGTETDAEMFSGITDDYDVSIKKETADAWHLLCKKSKNNTDKDAPKTIDLVISKKNYYPLSLSTKMSGVSMNLHDISFGVTEKQVTFNAADYPTAKIVDKR